MCILKTKPAPSPPPLVLYRSQEKQGHTMCLQSWRAVKDENSTVSQFLPLNFGSLVILNPIIILMLSNLSLSLAFKFSLTSESKFNYPKSALGFLKRISN